MCRWIAGSIRRSIGWPHLAWWTVSSPACGPGRGGFAHGFVSEAEDRLADMDVDNSIASEALVNELEREFRPEIDSSDGGENAQPFASNPCIHAPSTFPEHHSGMAITSRKPRSTILDVPTAKAGIRQPASRPMPRRAGGWPISVANGRRSAGLPALSLTARQTIAAGGPPAHASAGYWPAFGQPVPGTGCLRRSDVFELAGLRSAVRACGGGRATAAR